MKSKLFNRKMVEIFIWASLVSQILIVVTGGLVRLTGSGLGCPTWPKCTSDSLVAVPEQGIHGYIEFGNRLLTFALLVISVFTLVLILITKASKALRFPAILLLLGIPAQAVLGGLTVLFKLNPWLVGGHFVLSGLLIFEASALVWRFYSIRVAIPESVYRLTPYITAFGAISVLVGVVVTGAGPHSGDSASSRNGLDLEIWQHIHSYPAYVLVALTVWQLILQLRVDSRASETATRITIGLLLALVGQAVVGVVQARLGVPPLLVGIHMLGASVAISMIAFNHLANRAK